MDAKRAGALRRRLFVCGSLIATFGALSAAPAAADNLVQDPQFESGVSGFFAQDAGDHVVQSTSSPLQGANSLSVSINSYGNNVWWVQPFAGGHASHLQVSAHLRSDLASSSSLQFCAAYYSNGVLTENCTDVSGSVGDKGVVSAQIDIDPAIPLDDVRFHLSQLGSDPVKFTLDDAVADLVVPGAGGGGGGGGGSNGVNLIQDPQFESGTSGFSGQDDSTHVLLSDNAPLEGAHSLSVSINGFGNNVWWQYPFAGGLASHFQASAHLRSDVSSGSILQFCAAAYFADGSDTTSCTNVPGAAGDKGVVSAQIDIDAAKPLESLRIRLSQQGSVAVTFTLDDAVANLDVIQEPTGGDPPAPTCTVSPNSAYHPVAYNLPQTRPFISLADFTQVDQSSTAYTRFKQATDQAVANHSPDEYFATYSVIMYRITGNPAYINDAIERVDAFVNQADIDAHTPQDPANPNEHLPHLAKDRFYYLPFFMEPLALTYDAGYDQLTNEQRTKWAAFAEEALENLWNRSPAEQSWFGVPFPGSQTGWAVCDPGNNYYFGFLQGTMLWALSSQNTTWINFLQTQKFPPLIDYFTQFPGGGTREGTGYGTALKNLFLNYVYWEDSTNENLATITAHTRETIDYWVHATVPTLDRYAPIGDLSRQSIPDLYDYQRNLVHEAVVLSPGTAQARRGTWWLQHISVDAVSASFNLYGDLLPLPDRPSAPTDLAYYSSGAGVLFARSSWNTNASWLAFIAGKYDQSHAHQEQGSFTFFKNDWLTAPANIWSESGLRQEVWLHNGLRFEKANGEVIEQVPSDAVQSTLTNPNTTGPLSVTADLSNAYWKDSNLVQQWTRQLEYSGDTLHVTDTCSVANDVTPIFQLHVPVQPVLQPDGSVVAGHLRIVPLQGVAAPAFLELKTLPPFPGFDPADPSPKDFETIGWRISFTSSVGCSFSFQLNAQ
jgi:hypothetical protein